MANDCPDAAMERIEEARKLLLEFLNQENLVEDNDLADGLVRQMEAKAAIKEVVEEAEKEAIDMMVESCKNTNVAKITMSGKRPDGYIFETIIRKDGAVAYDEFTKEQLEGIRVKFAIAIYMRELTLKEPEEGVTKEHLQELSKKDLDVINVCQARLGRPEFSSLKQFYHNLSEWEK